MLRTKRIDLLELNLRSKFRSKIRIFVCVFCFFKTFFIGNLFFFRWLYMEDWRSHWRKENPTSCPDVIFFPLAINPGCHGNSKNISILYNTHLIYIYIYTSLNIHIYIIYIYISICISLVQSWSLKIWSSHSSTASRLYRAPANLGLAPSKSAEIAKCPGALGWTRQAFWSFHEGSS